MVGERFNALFRSLPSPGTARVEIHALDYSGLDPEAEAACARLLDREETRRHQAFLFPHDRREFAAGRALAKLALASLLGGPADALEIGGGAFAKPRLSGHVPGECGFDFNITHGGGIAAVGIAVGGTIGIDVERIDRTVDFGAIVPSFFSGAEAADLEALPDAERRERFFAIWTLKEAYLKALGIGLSGAGPGFSFALAEDGGARIAGPEVRCPAGMAWHFRIHRPGPRHILSAAGLFPVGSPPAFSLSLIPPDRFAAMLAARVPSGSLARFR